ncbi:MAG: type III pantothenate kinase [Bacteroidota bacterium]
MFLAIDIGNTNIKLGLHNGNTWHQVTRIESSREAPLEYFQAKLGEFFDENGITPSELSRIVTSSVVPSLKEILTEVFLDFFPIEPLWVGPDIYPLLNIKVPSPKEIGTDLVANVVATHHFYERNAIIVDFGTALTFTTLSGNGEVLGVSIAPGLKTAVKALFMNAAQLPEVPLEYPASVMGRDTIHAIQSGILVGYVGLVRYKLETIRNEVGQDFMAIATGGLSKILKPLEQDFEVVNRELTLEGLRIIGEQV